MANRGLKRVLGESSLERKCLWWFGVALGVLLVLTFLFSGQELREMNREHDKRLGQLFVKLAYAELHYEFMMEDAAEGAAQSDDDQRPGARSSRV